MEESNRYSKSNLILTLLFLGWIVSFIDRTAMNIAIAQIGPELNLDASQQGVILSSFFMGYALMQIPGGWLADRFGSRRVITVALIVWSIFTGLTGLAATLPVMIACRFLFGIGEGGYPAASTKAIADYFPKEKRSGAQATMMSSNALGIILGPIICAPLIMMMGWRNLFYLISLLGVVVVIFFRMATKESGSAQAAAQAVERPKGAYGELLRNSILWKTVLIFFCMNIANWGLASWMPTYLMNVMGIDLKSVGLVSAIPGACMAVGMVLSGKIIPKLGGKSKYGVIIAMFGMAISLYLLSNATSVVQALFFQSIANILCSFAITFVFTLPHRVMRPAVVGTAFGIVNFGGQCAGIVSPMVIGSLVQANGGSFAVAFVFLAAMCLIGAFIALTLPVKDAPKAA